jgi:hypothetical protein
LWGYEGVSGIGDGGSASVPLGGPLGRGKHKGNIGQAAKPMLIVPTKATSGLAQGASAKAYAGRGAVGPEGGTPTQPPAGEFPKWEVDDAALVAGVYVNPNGALALPPDFGPAVGVVPPPPQHTTFNEDLAEAGAYASFAPYVGDAATATVSVYSFADPSLQSGLEAGADVLGAAIPVLPAGMLKRFRLLGDAAKVERVRDATKARKAANSAQEADRLFGVGRHNSMPRPRPYEQSHHGVMSAWGKKNLEGYSAADAPAVR